MNDSTHLMVFGKKVAINLTSREWNPLPGTTPPPGVVWECRGVPQDVVVGKRSVHLYAIGETPMMALSNFLDFVERQCQSPFINRLQ